MYLSVFFFQAEDGIRDKLVTGVQTCALPISHLKGRSQGADAYPEPVTQWIVESSFGPPPWLVANATAALDRLLVPPSGLLRLWQERGQLALWEAALADLRTRLTA